MWLLNRSRIEWSHPELNPPFGLDRFGNAVHPDYNREAFAEVQAMIERHVAAGLVLRGNVNAPQPRRREYKDVPFLEDENKSMTRRISLPEFRHAYETLDEASRRLNGSLISVNGIPWMVADVQETDTPRDFMLLLQDEKGKRKKVLFSKIKDLRSCSPGYITMMDEGFTGTFWFSRAPARVTVQGIANRGVVRLKSVGSSTLNPLPSLSYLVKGLKSRDVFPWQPSIGELLAKGKLRDLRLSDHIAVYYDGDVKTEYKGRPLGVIKNREVTLDEDDKDVPWILKDLHAVNLKAE